MAGVRQSGTLSPRMMTEPMKTAAGASHAGSGNFRFGAGAIRRKTPENSPLYKPGGGP